MKDPYKGPQTRSFKLSKEFDDMIRVVATHEGRTASQTIRRALALYFMQGNYFSPDAAAELSSHKTLVQQNLEEE